MIKVTAHVGTLSVTYYIYTMSSSEVRKLYCSIISKCF